MLKLMLPSLEWHFTPSLQVFLRCTGQHTEWGSRFLLGHFKFWHMLKISCPWTSSLLPKTPLKGVKFYITGPHQEWGEASLPAVSKTRSPSHNATNSHQKSILGTSSTWRWLMDIPHLENIQVPSLVSLVSPKHFVGFGIQAGCDCIPSAGWCNNPRALNTKN